MKVMISLAVAICLAGLTFALILRRYGSECMP